jgi:hypothetical protein
MPLIHAKKCNATSKRSGNKCKSPAVTGNEKCRFHGGKSLKGFESPSLKTGAHSKFLSHLPDALKTDYTDVYNANQAQSLEEQLALSNLRTQQLLTLLQNGDLADLWSSMKASLSMLKECAANGEDITPPLRELQRIASIGEQNFLTWQQINNQNEQTRKLADTQIKLELGHLDRQIKENNYIPKEFVRAFVLKMADVVMELSPESIRHEQLSRIQKHFMSLPPVIRDDDAPKQLGKGK